MFKPLGLWYLLWLPSRLMCSLPLSSLLLWLLSLSPSFPHPSLSVILLPSCQAFPIPTFPGWESRQPNLANSDTTPCPDGPPRPGPNPTVLRFRDSLGPSGNLWMVPKKSSPRRKISKSPASPRGHTETHRHQARPPPPWKHLGLCCGSFCQKVQWGPSEHRRARKTGSWAGWLCFRRAPAAGACRFHSRRPRPPAP